MLADVYWLRQVLVNLLSLAILNMEEGSISVSSNNNTENNNYHDNVDPANIERVCNVMQAADQFFLDRLKQICEFHLQNLIMIYILILKN